MYLTEYRCGIDSIAALFAGRSRVQISSQRLAVDSPPPQLQAGFRNDLKCIHGQFLARPFQSFFFPSQGLDSYSAASGAPSK